MKRLLLCLTLLLTPPLHAQSWLDAIDDALTITNESNTVRADVSFLADLDLYAPEAAPQGTLSAIDADAFLQPRLSVFFDAQLGAHLTAHAQMRMDRGFDPGTKPNGDVRLDEYYLQWQVFDDDRIDLRAGRFATAFGAWTPRHLSWDNPFVTAPLAYGDFLPLTDHAAPASLAAFAARRNAPDNPLTWVPIIWGPSYATGAAISGRVDDFEYAIEMKNAALSSRPERWDAIQQVEFQTPATVTARLAWHPAPEWTVGTSFSHGSWMIDGNAKQTTYGLDAAYAHGHWQVWAEAIHARFDVPGIGDVHTTSAFIESKYKVTPSLWIAARWNQSWNGDIPGLADDLSYDRNAWRADLAIGLRLSRHAQLKLQYSYGDKAGADPEGDHLLAAQVTLKF